MLRFIKTGLLAALLVSSAAARAEHAQVESELAVARERAVVHEVNIDSVVSVGATTSLNENEVVVAAPGKGKIVATANADVFCSGDETSRTLVIDVNEAGRVTLEFCEAHLEHRDVTVRFVASEK